jgi:DNA-binding NtrC family response regulator
MDLNNQVKLLRVLQEKEVVRVGGSKTIKTDCRIIVATHKNLMDEVKEGRFREDLYYRLFGLPIELPPLRERDDDVILLAHFFISEFCKQNQLENKYLTEEARNKIKSYSWPGNVRELKSVIELAIVLSNDNEIKANDITLPNGSDLMSNLLLTEETMRTYNIRIVKHFLSRYNNDTKKVADILDIGQTTVYRLLKEAKEQES